LFSLLPQILDLLDSISKNTKPSTKKVDILNEQVLHQSLNSKLSICTDKKLNCPIKTNNEIIDKNQLKNLMKLSTKIKIKIICDEEYEYPCRFE